MNNDDGPLSPWGELWFWLMLVGIAVCLLALALQISEAEAQGGPCAPWATMRADLAERFKERVVSTGEIHAQAAFVVTASEGGKSFTALVVGADGMACVIATGHGWEPGILSPEGQGT